MIKILCVADTEYIKKYQPCIDSQIDYAKFHNYEHILITGEKEGRNWKHSKIDELEFLLKNTQDDIILIDGDCYIKDSCPPINFTIEKKSIYYVDGKSGRLNSGFLYFKNDEYSLEFVKELKEKLNFPVPRGKGYYVTKEGENGHIIWVKNEWEDADKNIFKKISKLWNCSSPKIKETAHILHFTNDLKLEIRNYNEEYFRSSSKDKK